MTSEKQQAANEENSKKGGVKTPQGKSISKYNSLKHGIFRREPTDYEKENVTEAIEEVYKEFQPESFEEKLLVSRVVDCLIKLARIHKAETENMLEVLHPTKREWVEGTDCFNIISIANEGEWVVTEEGYSAQLSESRIEQMGSTYLRYQVAIENRMYLALDRLREIKKRKRDWDIV